MSDLVNDIYIYITQVLWSMGKYSFACIGSYFR